MYDAQKVEFNVLYWEDSLTLKALVGGGCFRPPR